MTGSVAPDDARALFARWATGVSVVTARDADGDAGLTVNALLSVSLAPPSLLVSLTNDADTTPVIERTGRFAVSFLASDQRPLSEQFAKTVPRQEKFRGLALHRSPEGLPLLDGALGWLVCHLTSVVPAHDHRLLLGEVIAAERGRESLPLLFYRSAYSEAAGADLLRLPPPRR